MKQLHYIFCLLLVFGLSVETVSFGHESYSKKYDHELALYVKRNFSDKNSCLYLSNEYHSLRPKIFTQKIESLKTSEVHNKHTSIRLKSQFTLYQKLSSIIAQCVFLSEKLTSHHPSSHLYIA